MSILRWLPESLKDDLRRRAGAISERERLRNLGRAGFSPTHILDGGAYRGEWAQLAREVFPGARLLLVEPQPSLAAHLESVAREIGNAELVSAALGRTEGEARLLLEETNSRIVADDRARTDASTRVPVATIESLLGSRDFTDRCLLKLDLQGHELEALSGAGSWFGRAEAILVEVSWLRIGDVPIVGEVMAAFREKGYVAYDIFNHRNRPRDGALWQADIIFVQTGSALIGSRSWA